MRVLAVIPAKANSQRVPGKNTRTLGGRPTFLWTVDAAVQCPAIEQVLVSTDTHKVADMVRAEGFSNVIVDICPQVHASDDARQVVVHHARYNKRWGFDSIAMMLPTSPFRTATDAANVIERHRFAQRPVITVSAFGHGRKLRLLRDGAVALPDGDPVLSNGAVQVDTLQGVLSANPFDHRKALAYVLPMPNGLDIDTPEDWALAESFMAKVAA